MKRRGKTIIGLACGALLCAGLAACTKAETELDKKEKENYIVGVVYDPNGGKFNSNRTGITVENRFNPDSFTDADNDGRIEISLKSTDPVNYSQAPYELGAPKKPGYVLRAGIAPASFPWIPKTDRSTITETYLKNVRTETCIFPGRKPRRLRATCIRKCGISITIS